MQPFEAGATHPQRCTAFFAGQKIDRRPHAKRHRRGETLAVGMHPKLLFRSAETHDKHVGPCGFDLRQNGLVLRSIMLKTYGR